MLLATSLKRSCLAKKTIIVKNVTVNIEPLMRMRKAVFKNGHAAPVRGVRSGGSRRQVRGRVRPTRQGGEGDSCSGGHGARGCGVPEGITAGQRRCPSGQMRLDDV